MRACVVIPTYNESLSIAELIGEIKQLGLAVVVIDDGSLDNTVKIAQACGAIVLENAQNQGKGVSLRRGFDYSLKHDFDAVIAMDGDGQHSAVDIAGFLNLAKQSEAAIFVGNRMSEAKNMPLLRFLTNRFMSWLISLICNQHIPDTQCGFRMIKSEALEKINLNTDKFEIESELLIKAARRGFKIESVPIKTIYRKEKSRINPFIDTLRFIKFIIKVMVTKD